MRDHYGRLQSETVDGRTLRYDHDAGGRRIGRTTPSGAVSTWAYDRAGRRSDLTSGNCRCEWILLWGGNYQGKRAPQSVTRKSRDRQGSL
ncbi:hypothetical protein AB0M39_02375 [Streptomyces sp. NPDC051907]|uniref:hypothetical protein n=1 Tax=Streptomyces sp. NPDC051907 TaxID=3155284 RepID=UPI00342D9D16